LKGDAVVLGDLGDVAELDRVVKPVIAFLRTKRSRKRLFSSWKRGIARKRRPDRGHDAEEEPDRGGEEPPVGDLQSLPRSRRQSACAAQRGTTPPPPALAPGRPRSTRRS
jgi:hypothetical protein